MVWGVGIFQKIPGLSSRIPMATSVQTLTRNMAILSVASPKIPITLHTISDNKGATHERKRLGRGRASGHGKTCGRGQKGQKARSGNSKPRLGFEGGQTPLKKLIPKRGFTNVFAYDLEPLRLNRIQRWIDLGRLDPTKPITMHELVHSKCIQKIKDGVMLLGDGGEYLTTPIDIEITRATPNAINFIESLGGKVTARYYNMLGLQVLLHPEKYFIKPKFAQPTRKKDIAFYTNPDNRGYLAISDPKSSESPSA